MKNSVIAIQSFVRTIIVYAFLASIFIEMDNVYGGENFVVDNDNNVKATMYNQQIIDSKCKSPCPSSAEMCIAMCA